MDFNNRVTQTGAYVAGSVMSKLLSKVFLWMTIALGITGLTSMLVYNSSFVFTLMQNPMLMWGLVIAELIMVIALSAAINKISFTAATLMFIIYSILNGVMLSSIFLIYTQASISLAFFVTAGTFGAMALWGYTTRRDLSKMGSILFMALIGLIIATIVNIFLKSSAIYWITTYAGVLIFTGLTAWDVQKIKRMLSTADEVNDTTKKVALLGALSLYLDFINLFLYILRIFGNKN
ncbi:membrane protein [Porphyromonas macacae]|uniref:Inner membrane protein YbhL n=1 Tax=Porphyromonas macacae TaxID=28115 RepID=A0A379EBE1_9PORP|nr:Bax inhibitor-1/YccA family protein [Porphyromonas macacae]KGN99602.1 membrane protein [Porphyromonas macacae]SUB89839.1 Inner membrane protein YbhL [Porphyromonas macacae]